MKHVFDVGVPSVGGGGGGEEKLTISIFQSNSANPTNSHAQTHKHKVWQTKNNDGTNLNDLK